MSILGRIGAAYGAYKAFGAQPAVGERLPAPPPSPPGPTGPRPRTTGRRRRISPIAIDRTRWLRADIEAAEIAANSGQLQQAAQIADWCKGDLVVGGLLGTRCSVPRLPREWRGDDEARHWLQGEAGSAGVFDTVYPPGELEEFAIDHLVLGIGVGVFIQPQGAPFPKFIRLDNQYLRYLPGQNRYQYQGYGRVYDVEPGNGVWVLHCNGAQDPWRRGIWAALGYDQVSEDGAGLHRDAFIWRYGNPFVIAKAPLGAAEMQKLSFWNAVRQWTMGFAGVTPGHEVSLLQPKAEGREVFNDAEERVERRAMMRIAGQVVTSLGGPGFANAEIFARITSDLVMRTGQDLAATMNEQMIPQVLAWAARRGYVPAGAGAILAYDTTPPQAREAEAKAIEAAMRALVAQAEAAEKIGDQSLRPSASEYRARFRLPVEPPAAAPARVITAPSEPEDQPTPDQTAVLAQEMTNHGIDRCEHGRSNRCPLCGIERERGVIPGVDGAAHSWRIGWRPIAREAA